MSNKDENIKDTTKDNVKEQEEKLQDTHQDKSENVDNQQGVEDEIAKLKAEVEESKDKYLRLFAEFDNYRKRTNKEKLELRKTAAADTLTALLPVLDDFDRAKKNHDDASSTEEFSEGVMFVYDKVLSFMKKQGLEAIDSTGEAFDVNIHEAITEIPAPTEEMKGKIIDTVELGYKLNDKVIRYAKVVIGK